MLVQVRRGRVVEKNGVDHNINGSGRLAVDRVTRRGSDEDEKNWGGS